LEREGVDREGVDREGVDREGSRRVLASRAVVVSVVRIVRPHRLDHAHIRAEVEALATELEHKLHARCHWDGDTLRFSRAGASGHIEVGKDSIAIEVKLGMVLAPLRAKVERTVTDYLDRHLA
jgi:putative polyhydroxyalkanoate system protein